MSIEAVPLRPVPGARFEYEGRNYRLNSFLCEVSQEPAGQDLLSQLLAEIEAEEEAELAPGVRRVRLRWCLPEEATYVSGSGVAGCIAPIDEITVVGMVPWPAAELAELEASALRKGQAGQFAMTLERVAKIQTDVII